MNPHIDKSIRNAFQLLRIAENELVRPQEDAVLFCSCQSTRNSASGFLKAYLLSHSYDKFQNDSLSELLNQCAKIDPHFKAIDLSCFDCRTEHADVCDEKYCLSLEKVNKCFERTNVIRELVMAKLKLSQKDFA